MTMPGDDLDVTARMNELLDEDRKNLLMYLHTGEPATVIAFKPAHINASGEKMPATVDCKLGFHRAYRGKDVNGNDTIVESEDYVIPSRPIIFPGFAPAMVHMPDLLGNALIGSWGWLAPNSSSFDDVMVRGAPTLPSAKTKHNINHSMFVPGIIPGPDGSMDLEPNIVKMGAQNGDWKLAYDLLTKNVQLATTGPEATIDAATSVKIGANAVDAAASGTKADANTSALLAALNAFTPTPGDGGAALATALKIVISNWSSVSAIKAKVE